MSDRTRQKNKRGDIEKWDQTDSPEIPDRGETSEIPPASLRGIVQSNSAIISTGQNSTYENTLAPTTKKHSNT